MQLRPAIGACSLDSLFATADANVSRKGHFLPGRGQLSEA